MALVVGSWKASGTGTSSPSCSQELGCEPALYRQRFPGRFQRCWSRDGHPSPSLSPSHPGSTAPCTSSPRSHISELCHLHIPQRHIRAVPCPEGPGPAINQPGLPLPHPCATPGAAELPDFPCPPSTALSPEVDAELQPGCAPVQGAGLGPSGNAWEPGTEGASPSVLAPPRLQGHILAPALASLCWLIFLGSWWGSSGAGIPSAALPALQIFFLRVMFLVLIPFAFSQLSRPVAYHRHR